MKEQGLKELREFVRCLEYGSKVGVVEGIGLNKGIENIEQKTFDTDLLLMAITELLRKSQELHSANLVIEDHKRWLNYYKKENGELNKYVDTVKRRQIFDTYKVE